MYLVSESSSKDQDLTRLSSTATPTNTPCTSRIIPRNRTTSGVPPARQPSPINSRSRSLGYRTDIPESRRINTFTELEAQDYDEVYGYIDELELEEGPGEEGREAEGTEGADVNDVEGANVEENPGNISRTGLQRRNSFADLEAEDHFIDGEKVEFFYPEETIELEMYERVHGFTKNGQAQQKDKTRMNAENNGHTKNTNSQQEATANAQSPLRGQSQDSASLATSGNSYKGNGN